MHKVKVNWSRPAFDIKKLPKASVDGMNALNGMAKKYGVTTEVEVGTVDIDHHKQEWHILKVSFNGAQEVMEAFLEEVEATYGSRHGVRPSYNQGWGTITFSNMAQERSGERPVLNSGRSQFNNLIQGEGVSLTTTGNRFDNILAEIITSKNTASGKV